MISPLGILQSDESHAVSESPCSGAAFLSFLLTARCVVVMMLPIKTLGPGLTLMMTLIFFAVVSTCSSDER